MQQGLYACEFNVPPGSINRSGERMKKQQARNSCLRSTVMQVIFKMEAA